MSELNIAIQFILIVVLLVVALYLLKLSKALRKEKRIANFTIDAITDKPMSFFDKIANFYAKIISNLSKVLKKSAVFTKYSEKYEKYVDQTKRIRTDKMDYISTKIVISLLACFITIISDVLRLKVISPLQLLLALLIGFFIPDIFLAIDYKRKQHQMENDLLKAVIIMNNAFKSGRSIMQSVALVSTELTGPIAEEFKKMSIDLTYGLDIETVFERFSSRVRLEEVKYMSSSLVILNKTGGNIVNIFSSIEKGFFDRKKLNDELKSTTALSSLVFKVLVAMPFLIFLVIYILNPHYFDSFITTVIGKIILVIILAIYILYILIVRKIMSLKEW